MNKLGILDVISCHEVQPRRSRWQRSNNIVPIDRKAFRLCIPRDDCVMLLNEDAWPAHVTISAWRFNTKKSDCSSDRDYGDAQRVNNVNNNIQDPDTRQSTPAAMSSTGVLSTLPAIDRYGGSAPSNRAVTEAFNSDLNVKLAMAFISSSPVHSVDQAESRLTVSNDDVINTSDMDLTITINDGC